MTPPTEKDKREKGKETDLKKAEKEKIEKGKQPHMGTDKTERKENQVENQGHTEEEKGKMRLDEIMHDNIDLIKLKERSLKELQHDLKQELS